MPFPAITVAQTDTSSHCALEPTPVAYVYPILGFLAGTYPGGADPPWIINGTYENDAFAPKRRARSSLAAPSFQQWLPDTMVAFAEQTGAGGFGFDYTYFEQNTAGITPRGPDTRASKYAQWTGWRQILRNLHLAKGGKACAGNTSCVVDNRQSNHAWGPWVSVSSSADSTNSHIYDLLLCAQTQDVGSGRDVC